MIGVFDGILDLRSGLGRRIRRSDLFSHALRLPAGDMRIVAAVILIFAVYFPAALYLKHSHVASSLDLRPLSIMSIAASGSCASTIWAPDETTKVAIYEDGIRTGYALKIYDDPGRPERFRGRHFKMVEFYCPDGPKVFHGLVIE